jgi:ABC-type proline/glycine betaine transport system ATPase subunit
MQRNRRLDAFEDFLGKSECGKTHVWKLIRKLAARKLIELGVIKLLEQSKRNLSMDFFRVPKYVINPQR